MDDFLYNLRNNANQKRHDGNRKPYGAYNRNYDRNRGKDNKGGYYNRTIHQEYLPLLKKAIDEISASYKRMAEAGERRARAEERQAKALEMIASVTTGQPIIAENEIEVQDDSKVETTESSTENENAEVSETTTSPETEREKIVGTIRDMRNNNISYDKIAQFLSDKGVPTITGKGQWRAQTVSRLYRQSTSDADFNSI